MDKFYNIEENFEFFYNNISRLLDETIIESSISENWLVNWYVCNRYNTTRAVERHAAEVLLPKVRQSGIPEDVFQSIIDKKLNGCFESYNDVEYTIEDKIYMVNNLKTMCINENTLSYIIQDFECDDIVEYMRENFDYEIEQLQLTNESKKVMGILSKINQTVLENKDNQDRLETIKGYNTAILYKYKYTTESFNGELNNLYKKLEGLLETQNDDVIDYSLKELDNINSLIEHMVKHNLDESAEEFIYDKVVNQFNYLVEDIFVNKIEEGIDINQFFELYILTEAICEYESTLEASSRIITKGTEKVTKAIDNSSAKARGISKSDSKMAQIKRGAKIVDDRASTAINNKIDQVINFTQDAKREKLITGKTSIQLGKTLKTVIGWIVAGVAVKNLPKQTILKLPGLSLKAPLLGIATTIIGLLATRALSKNTEEREKKRILLELETELKITREKIEDAKGDNAREQKYQLMRIEANLEKEIMRIKHGLRYY